MILSLLSCVMAATQDEKLYWGTYRPYPYVGLRARSPASPLLGLMWYKPSLQAKGLKQVRHECSYYDEMAKFGWTKHDGEGFAEQLIEDPGNNVALEVSWVKPDLETDPNHWVLRVKGSALEESSMDDLTLMWYVATPDNETATFNHTGIYG